MAVGFVALGAVLGVSGCKKELDNSQGANPQGAILQAKNLVSSTDSPVVVRGGAITIRTTDTTDGWVSAAGGTVYCTYIPLGSPLNLYPSGVDKINGTTPISDPLPLTGTWKVTINGRAPKYVPPTPASPGYWDSTTPSANGIVLQGSNSNCTGATSTQSTVVLTTTGTYGRLYLPDIGLHEESTVDTAKRFMDTTPNSGATPSICAGPNSNLTTGNEDSCERASTITVTTSAGSYSGRCRNGECTLGIGK
jgi:hypothetical protein